jgi:hypothetical protein
VEWSVPRVGWITCCVDGDGDGGEARRLFRLISIPTISIPCPYSTPQSLRSAILESTPPPVAQAGKRI